MNFALLGAAGFVAPRHMRAIADTGHRLIAACDPHDSVGILDSYFLDAKFFTEVERFDRHLEKLRRRRDESERVHYVSICSPNYLHDAHVRLALRVGAAAICEKPMVINPWNLDQLAEIEKESAQRVYTVLQLRHLPSLLALRERARKTPRRADVVLSYITRRGRWYQISWKNDVAKSGGLPTNIGIHFFDLLQWVFGPMKGSVVHLAEPVRWAGRLELENADVRWFLSTDQGDLPEHVREAGGATFRSLDIDGEPLEFSSGFKELHTRVYQATLDGQGHGIEDARPSIEIAHRIRTSTVRAPDPDAHPMVKRRG